MTDAKNCPETWTAGAAAGFAVVALTTLAWPRLGGALIRGLGWVMDRGRA